MPAILVQNRIGKSELKSNLHAIGAEDSDDYECRQKETVKQVLLDCGRGNKERRELRAAEMNKSRWGDMSYLLGGWSWQKYLARICIDEEAVLGKPAV